MKSYLKFVLLLVGLSLLLWQCQKDNFIENVQTEIAESIFKTNTVKLSDIPDIKDFLTHKSKTNIFNQKTIIDGAIFDVDNIMEVIDTLNHTNYSFRFTYPSTPRGVYYNLVVGKSPEGVLKTPYVLKYVTDSTYTDAFIENNYDFRFFKGTVGLHKFTDYFQQGGAFKTVGDTFCPPEYDANGDPIACDNINLDGSGVGTGGGGSGSDGGIAPSGDGISSDGGDTGGGSDGTGGGTGGISSNCTWYTDVVPTTPCPSTDLVNYCLISILIIDCPGLYDMSKTNTGLKTSETVDCPDCPTDGDGGVGVSLGFENADIIENQITDNNLDPCSKGILNDLKNLQVDDISNILKRFGGPESVYNWEIKTGTPSNSLNAAETDWLRGLGGISLDYEYITTINTAYVKQATKIGLARTILHEMLHAYLISLVDDVTITGSTDIKNFPLLWNALVNNIYDNNPNHLQHEIIGRKFIEPLRDALKEWDGNAHTNQYYEDLAWGALEKTATFNTLFPVGSTDRNRILNTNLAEDTNTIQGNITPKSNSC